MNKINNLGYHTDCIAKKLDGIFAEKDSYTIIRMPMNPTFYWGNLLLFKNEPQQVDYECWISAYQLEFGKDCGHLTFGWESQKVGNIDKFLDNGFSLESGSVLVLEELCQNGASCEGLTIREIVSDDDWEAVLKLQILVSEVENPGEAFEEFKLQSFRTYRKLSEAGHGAWWGAFIGDTLVGDMGLYFDDPFETGRFQSVETHPDYRRRGICSQLLHSVSRRALDQHPKVQLVIGTNMDSDAEAVYKRLGFRRHQLQYGVCLPRQLKLD